MGGYAEDRIMNAQLRRLTEEPQLGIPSAISQMKAEQMLINQFQNVDLNSDSFFQNTPQDHEAQHSSAAAAAAAAPHRLPLRPYAADCSHYLRTGTCKYAMSCRYNHPLTTTIQAVKGKSRSSVNAGQIECKYYFTPGGCRNGTSCKYSHSKHETEIAVPEFNVLGLPIRMGEKECPYYMRYGSCGYGHQCVFNHPEPILPGESDTLGASFNEESMMKSGYSFGNSDNECPVLSGASQQDQGPWFLHPSLSKALVNQNQNLSYMNTSLIPQGAHTEWSAYQAAELIPRSTMAHVTPKANRAEIIPDQNLSSTNLQELPERPGQPLCAHLLKTGDCKFKSTCRFHHPKNWVSKLEECVLSDKGLPLRPGREVCRHYGRFGICKFGHTCLFDHPVDIKFAPYSHRSPGQTATGNDRRSMMH